MDSDRLNEFCPETVEEEGVDWRLRCTKDDRQAMVETILGAYRFYPGQDGMKLAIKYEEEFYNEATSRADYSSKVIAKMSAVQEEAISSFKKGVGEFLEEYKDLFDEDDPTQSKDM